jgi:hypothetical protein
VDSSNSVQLRFDDRFGHRRQVQGGDFQGTGIVFFSESVYIIYDQIASSSGVSQEERGNVARLIEHHGGRFSGEMKKNETTHLITDLDDGDKYRKALKWGNVMVVQMKWLTRSIEQVHLMSCII